MVGSGGLIGSAVASNPNLAAFEAARIPWRTDGVVDVLREERDRFADWVDGDDWGIVWAAGSGVMRTGESELDLELEVFTAFCRDLGAGPPAGRGGFYLISSAGGMYAGSDRPPLGLQTEPRPLNAYGRMKAAQEALAIEVVAPRIPVTIGRLSNAYGPRQDLSKQQGLVTHLARSALLGQPATIFAPLTTLRDYLYVDDAARCVTADLHRMATADPSAVTTLVVASGRTVSIAELIAVVERVSGRNVPLMHQLSDGPHFPDLRLEPATGLGEGQMTPLEAGVALVLQDLQVQLAGGRLAVSV